MTGLFITGPSSVDGNSMVGYIATAFYSDGNTQIVIEKATWMSYAIYALIYPGQ